jgi:hypothetical protein
VACEHSPSSHHLLDGSEPEMDGAGGSGCGQCDCPNSRAIALGDHCGELEAFRAAPRTIVPNYTGTPRPLSRKVFPVSESTGKPSAPLYDAKMRQKEFEAAIRGLRDSLKAKRRRAVDLALEIEADDVQLRQLQHRKNRHQEDNNL